MNILFDFDGTLSDSLDSLLLVLNPYLKLFRQNELTSSDVREKGAHVLLTQYQIPKFVIPTIVIYGRWKLGKLIPNLKPFPHIKKTIKELSKSHTLGVITSNSTNNVNAFFKNNDMDSCFDFVYSSINYFNKSIRIRNALQKHSLKPSNTFFVTDETRDIISAKLCNIKTVAVTWGLESESLIRKSNPDLLINNPEELLQIPSS